MYVACSTLCFARLPLERALRLIGELEFSKLDVAIHEQGPHLKPSEVAADVPLAAQRIRIGPSLTPAAFDVQILTDSDAECQRQLRALCRLARISTVSTITLSAADSGTGLDAEVTRLAPLVQLAEAEGIVLTVATPHRHPDRDAGHRGGIVPACAGPRFDAGPESLHRRAASG